jgi:signal transduction histidine kinase
MTAATAREAEPAEVAHPDSACERGGGASSVELLAELSHDLRTPLASVRLLVEGLRDGTLAPARRDEYLARIEQQLSLVTELVDQLHSAARDRVPDAPAEAISPQKLIEAAIETIRAHAEASSVLLEIDAPPCLPMIRANRIQLHRALVNLLENAIRHAPAQGTVAVRAQWAGGGVEIEVRDDGAGIAVDERSHAFTAFYGRDRRISPQRSGLGLAIARATIEAHGGQIWLAESATGTRVRLSLPTRLRHHPALATSRASRSKF